MAAGMITVLSCLLHSMLSIVFLYWTIVTCCKRRSHAKVPETPTPATTSSTPPKKGPTGKILEDPNIKTIAYKLPADNISTQTQAPTIQQSKITPSVLPSVKPSAPPSVQPSAQPSKELESLMQMKSKLPGSMNLNSDPGKPGSKERIVSMEKINKDSARTDLKSFFKEPQGIDSDQPVEPAEQPNTGVSGSRVKKSRKKKTRAPTVYLDDPLNLEDRTQNCSEKDAVDNTAQISKSTPSASNNNDPPSQKATQPDVTANDRTSGVITQNDNSMTSSQATSSNKASKYVDK